MIAALYCITKGVYDDPKFDLWDELRDARKYVGPYPVIAHPPCQRWGKYWGGGPLLHNTKNQRLLGDDAGCFAHSLWAVRTFSGVLEHPEGSHAFRFFGLPIPNRKGGWSKPDIYGGRSCSVAQGHYGHAAQKYTWLYAKITNYPELIWGGCTDKMPIEESLTKEERSRLVKTGTVQRIPKLQRLSTPEAFKNLLVSLIKGAA